MNQKELQSISDTHRFQAEHTAERIAELRMEIRDNQNALQQHVENYQTNRASILIAKLNAQRLTWCTACGQIFSKAKAKLVLISGAQEEDCGMSQYTIRVFAIIHRACPNCLEKFQNKHGWLGPIDRVLKKQSSFYAFMVEKREDGLYAKKFGSWEKIEHVKNLVEEPPNDSLVQKLAKEYNLPPQIRLEYPNGFNNPELVILE